MSRMLEIKRQWSTHIWKLANLYSDSQVLSFASFWIKVSGTRFCCQTGFNIKKISVKKREFSSRAALGAHVFMSALKKSLLFLAFVASEFWCWSSSRWLSVSLTGKELYWNGGIILYCAYARFSDKCLFYIMRMRACWIKALFLIFDSFTFTIC